MWMVRCCMIVSMLSLIGLCSVQSATGSQPYCGVHALYGAANALGVEVRFDELISPKFISSGRGSSATDLQEAAEHIGLRATPLMGLGRTSLYSANKPLCLHVSPLGAEGTYNHWVLYLGMEGDDVLIHDGPGGVTRCSIESLLARWDGVALAISRPGDPTNFYGSELRAFGVLFLIVAGMLILVNRIANTIQVGMRGTIVLFIGCITIFSSWVYASRSLSPGARHARQGVDAALGFQHFANVELSDFPSIVENEQPTIIDSRFRHDFARGTIPGAVNIPVDVGLGEFRNQIKQLPRDKPVIVFCQSKDCHFSSIVATMLSGDGFIDVRVLGDGYVGWKQQ